MSYMYNALNCNNYNRFSVNKTNVSFSSKENSRPVVYAPDCLPKYSVKEEIRRQEEFRNSVQYNIHNKKQEKASLLQKTAVASTVAAVALFALSKK